jgi:hypothetical protein
MKLSKLPELPLDERVRRAYRVLCHPTTPQDRGYQAWFRDQLRELGDIEVAPSTLHRWLRDRVPYNRLVAVDDVMRALEVTYQAVLRQKLIDAIKAGDHE